MVLQGRRLGRPADDVHSNLPLQLHATGIGTIGTISS
jgi:hypothetical protein